MAFDLTTATEDKEYVGSFDLSTATEEDNQEQYQQQYRPAVMYANNSNKITDGLKSAFDFVTQVPVSAFMEQHKNNKAANLRMKGMYRRMVGQDLSEQEKERIKELDNPYRLSRYNEANNYGIHSRFILDNDGEYFDKGSAEVFGERFGNSLKRFYADATKQTAILYDTMISTGKGAAVGAISGAALGVAKGLVTRDFAGIPKLMKDYGKTGAILLSRGAAAKKIAEMEAGFQRQELETLNEEFIAKGIEPLSDLEMDRIALSVGIINATLEYVGLAQVLKAFPNGDKILGKLFGSDAALKLAKDQTFRSQLSQIGNRLAISGISEGSTESIQEITNFVASNMARNMRDVVPVPLADKIDEILYSGLIGSVCAFTMGGVGTAAQVANIKARQGIDAIKAKKEADAMTIDERNEFINKNISMLTDIAKEQADETINALKGQVTYNRIKDEMELQGATSELADNSAQVVQQLHNAMIDKFGNDGEEHLKKSNLQILINQNNNQQIAQEEQFIDEKGLTSSSDTNDIYDYSGIEDFTNIKNKQKESAFKRAKEKYLESVSNEIVNQNAVSIKDNSVPKELQEYFKNAKEDLMVIKAYRINGQEGFIVFEKGKGYVREQELFTIENGSVKSYGIGSNSTSLAKITLTEKQIGKLHHLSNNILAHSDILTLSEMGKSYEDIISIILDLKEGKSFFSQKNSNSNVTTTNNTTETRRTQKFKPSELLTDAATFQYKDNSDENGVTERLQGVEAFDPLYAGKIIVYETKEGQKYVVDGHQRLGLAKRLGGDNVELEGFLFKEEDGYTPEQMRLLAAQKNIAEGSGTAIDTAKIIREIGLDNLPKTIPTNSAMVKNGISLSRLSDEAFQKVINGEIAINEAAVVADILRNDEVKQLAAIEGIKKDKRSSNPRFKNLNRIAIYCNDVAEMDTREYTQTNLFGDFSEFESPALEKAELVDKAIKSLQKDKKIFSGLLRNDNKVNGKGKNVLDKQTNERIIRQADVIIELIQKNASRVGIVADKANELAALVKDGKMSMEDAVKEFKAFVMQKDVITEFYGNAVDVINYNQAAIGEKINTDKNILTALEEISEDEDGIITPEEFYRKGLYQSAKAEDLSNWQAKYPDIAEALAEQERMKKEGLLPPTVEINTKERMELRQDIADDLYGKGAKSKNKQAYLIIGSPASGKSSMANPLQEETGSLIIDSDMAKEKLPEFIESDGKRADQVHEESSKIAEIVLNKAISNGDNVILPIVGKSEKSIMKKFDSLAAAGYDVHLRLVYLPTEITVDRAVNRYRATGRLVPIDYIVNEVGFKPAENYVILVEKGQFKSYEAISTEVEYGEKPKQITAEEIKEQLQARGLRLQQNEIQGRNELVQRSDWRGNGNRIEYHQSSNFDNYFGDSKVVDEDGNAKHLWHGSINTFEIFDKERADKGGDMGGGFYFTDSESDADANYHGGGADFEIKVERLAERLQGENELEWEEAKEQAREQLIGTPSMLEVYLRIENPCYVGENETILLDYESVREQAEDRINREDYESEEDYEQELQYAIEDTIYDIQDEVSSKLYDLLSDRQIEEVRNVIADVAYEGGTNLENLKKRLNELDLENYEIGDYVSPEVARLIVESLGYDGIIDSTVSTKFNMDIEAGTTHYIAFYPEQIKSVDNLGTFDRNDPNIYHQGENNPRGLFRVDENGTAIIDILENGDASTVIHELGHFYLYSLETLAQNNTRAAKELTEINKWLGKEDGKEYTAEEQREFHEKFARGFEVYLMEGSAPTKGLQRVFHNFKSWLRDIYNSAKDLDIDFSEATQMLFDRVFTTDEEYEKQVLPKYQFNYAKAIELEAITNSPQYKFKKGLKEFGEKFSLWYDKLFLPIETRIGKISPALRDKLRNHTAELALIKGKDLKIASCFLGKTEELKNINYEDYVKLDLALKNRDEHTVKILADKYGFTQELNAVQDLLEDIYNEALSVGLDVGYLDNYYPRLVKADLTEKYLEYIDALARKEQMDVVNQVIKLEDAKISMVLKDLADADPNGFWSAEDRSKFINNRIRGFGKNNILLSRNASLKFERSIEELDGNFNQFYETLEPALVNYISKSRDVIEARKFFGNEIKEVGKLRARIKRKTKTLEEVKDRKPSQAKNKEIDRIKYELNPLKVQLENLEKWGDDLYEDQIPYRDNLRKKVERLEGHLEFVEKMHPVSVKNMVLKRLRGEIKEAGDEIRNLIGDEQHVEDSIGALITNLVEDGQIYYKDERLIREMLLARFNATKACEPIRMIRDLSYIATLNDITNAITQFGDLAFSVYKYGFSDTFKGLKKPFDITKEDLALDSMALEFTNPSGLSKWLKKQFEVIGLSAIDGMGKNAIIQASLLNAQRLAKAGNKEFIEKLERIYGENAAQMRKDFVEGNITDDVIIYAFHALSDIQPISEDQVTELYQSGTGYMKLFYTLKTYGIKALDIARVDITNNIVQGIKNKNKAQVKNGLQNLIKLQMLLWLFGVPIDSLKDLLSNRDLNIFESMVDNLIPFFIVSRYMIKDVFDSGAGTAIANFFTPAIASTAKKALSGKASSVSHIPLIGKPIYNWFLKDR